LSRQIFLGEKLAFFTQTTNSFLQKLNHKLKKHQFFRRNLAKIFHQISAQKWRFSRKPEPLSGGEDM
jgi:hypothetical protein